MEGLFWIVAGLAVCALGWKAGLGSFQEPGSGFIAFLVGMLISILGLLFALSRRPSKALPNARPASRSLFRGTPAVLFLVTVGGLLGYGVLLESLGYILTTFLLMWALFYLFYEQGKRRILWSFAASAATTGASYLVFDVWLLSQLPRGLFPWW